MKLKTAANLLITVLLTLLAGCIERPPKPPCNQEYGNYVAVAPNGDLAVSYCKKGKRGILLRKKAGEEWLEPPAALYTTPAFSPDGAVLLFTQIDFEARTSALLAYDLAAKTTSTILRSNEAISFSALTPDKKEVYFWAGTFRQAGMTGAADFRLHRRSLSDGKDVVLDGPYFVAYGVSVDEKGGVHYAYDGEDERGSLYARARKVARDKTKPVDLEFPGVLGGDVIYTTRGHYRKVRGKENARYKYCVVGPGLDGSICQTKDFSISFDGKLIAYFDSQHQLQVKPIPE